jgi:hypothetical protein
LYSLNPSVDLRSNHTKIPDSWTDFDHVGGSFKQSIPLISSDDPDGTIDLLAEYWLPDYPDHPIKSGKISIKVSGKDHTSPQMSWINIADDNIIQIKLYDGGEVSKAKATLQLVDNPDSEFRVDLNDQGMEGDNIAGDQVFSKKITVPKFGVYQISIAVSDDLGNERRIKIPKSYVFYGAKLYHE